MQQQSHPNQPDTALGGFPLQLLAPARNAEVAIQAILHGADAVYIGGPSHGARAAAANSLDDIARVVDFAHSYRARVYATLNTLVYESELSAAEQLVRDYWRIGVDALIVQDLSLLRMQLPPIALHASTQCDIRTPQKARFLADAGFSQLVLPRELTIDEIREIRAAVPPDIVLEAFVHGALCVCYSGDCRASYVANGRSANRGECAQMCRMRYNIYCGPDRIVPKDIPAQSEFLSLRDLKAIELLPQLIDAGISSFKIEGRLKDANYVKNTVAAYSRALDDFIAGNPAYRRDSLGDSRVSFVPDLSKSFNRGYITQVAANRDSLSRSPKFIGEAIGTVTRCASRSITARLKEDIKLNNGDGLGYFDRNGEFCGFRLNRVDGCSLFPASAVDLPIGTKLYRNSDAHWEASMAANTAQRAIPIRMDLNYHNGILSLSANVNSAITASYSIPMESQVAKTPQKEARARVLGKLGDTRFSLSALADNVAEDVFIPASILANLRRDAIAALDSQMRATYPFEKRRKEVEHIAIDNSFAAENVANSLSRKFYEECGFSEIHDAIETMPKAQKSTTVMTTRFCLRRQLGACLKEGGARKLPEPIFLENNAARYRLSFDCSRCQMHLLTILQ